MEEFKRNTYEYINLDSIEYEYTIEEITLDVNRFEVPAVEKPEKKKDKQGKDTKGKKGKKKKGDEDDLKLSKESSKLSIYSIKPGKKPNIQLDKRDKDRIKNLMNSGAAKGIKNINVLMDKIKATIVKKDEPKKPEASISTALTNQPVEEVIDTNVPVKVNITETFSEHTYQKVKGNTASDIVISEVNNQKAAAKDKKNKKGKNDSKKQAEANKETKAAAVSEKQDKQDKNVQNKKVEDLLKGFKDKKSAKGKSAPDEKISIMNLYLTKHKYLFSLDPTKKLKLRELGSVTTEAVASFFDITDQTFKSMEGTAEDEFTKQNIREACSLLDNICELIQTAGNPELLSNTLDKSLDNLLDVLTKHLPNSKTYVINILYTFIKYQNDASFKDKNLTSDKLLKTYETLSNDLLKYLTENGKLEELSENETLNYYLFARSLAYIALTGLDKSKINEAMLLDENIKLLIKALENILSESDDFFDDFNNLKFFTKFNHLFDYHRSKFYVLTIKTSKFIENSLTEIQNTIMRNNNEFFLRIINNILLKYLNNFDIFYENNEPLYEEIFALMKFIIEDKSLQCNSLKQTINDIQLEDLNLQSDDFVTKYIILLVKYIKYFEKAFNTGDESDIQIYLDYHHQVLFKILSVRQGYIREKYFKIMEKSIEPHIGDEKITELICRYITTFIQNTLQNNYNTNLVKNVKFIKEITKFYSGYMNIKKNILTVFGQNEFEDNVGFALMAVFYLNFLKLDKAEDYKLLLSILNNSEIFIENLLLIDKRRCSYLMKYYINEEIQALENIIDLILVCISKGEINIPLETIVRFIFNKLIEVTSHGGHSADLNNLLKIFEQFITKGLLTNEKLEVLLFDFIKAVKGSALDLNKITVIMFFINKLIVSYDYEATAGLVEKINSELGVNTSNYTNVANEIKLVNDHLKDFKKDYIKNTADILPYLLQLIVLAKLLEKDPSLFKVEDIQIESIPEPTISDQNIVEGEVKPEEAIVNEEVKVEENNNNKVNLNIVLHIFNNYIDIVDKNIHQGKEINMNILNISTVQEIINLILNNETIFSSLVNDKNLLEQFIKKYIGLKEISFRLSEAATKELRLIETEMTSLKTDNLLTISHNLLITEISEKISLNCANFIKYRCKDQIIYLFSEVDIYKMFMTKDREFLLILYKQLSLSYQKTIINQEKLSGWLSKAQSEEEDYLEDVAHSIFSKQVINYLECPEEIIEFLTTMNDALKYDFKVERKEFYNNLFSYFYLWKAIMSKIENGFKLYTSDKQHVKVIDNYKILLKFIVNYLERNNRIYEMFLLISISLMHLIDDEKMLEGDKFVEDLEHFDDTTLNDSFDRNSFNFILSVFYKFVKIFPTLVKYYYDEKKSKLKNTIKRLITQVTLPKMLGDIKTTLTSNTVFNY
jgi:hypothetical protein